MRNSEALSPIILLIVAASISGCSPKEAVVDSKSNAGTKPSIPVLVARAESMDVPVELRNIGNVEAYSTVTIRSQITGQITKIHFQEGHEVKAGDLLFTIDPRPSQGALNQARADLKRDEAQLVTARLEFERTKKLFESNIASKDDFDKAEANFRALEATILGDQALVNKAELNLEFTAIRSPIDGVTGNLMVKEGNIVKAPDDTLVTINQIHPIYVTFSVPEQDLPAIRKRLKETKLRVDVELPKPPVDSNEVIDPPKGDLTFIDNTVDATTGRIKLKGTFPNADNMLWPGQYVQATLVLNTLSNATVLPSHAIQSSQNGEFVFVVNPDFAVEKRDVIVGLSHGGSTVLSSGVQAGEIVVTDGHLRLAAGTKVSYPNLPASKNLHPNERAATP